MYLATSNNICIPLNVCVVEYLKGELIIFCLGFPPTDFVRERHTHREREVLPKDGLLFALLFRDTFNCACTMTVTLYSYKCKQYSKVLAI